MSDVAPIQIKFVSFHNCGTCPVAAEWQQKTLESKRRIIEELGIEPDAGSTVSGLKSKSLYYARPELLSESDMERARQHAALYEAARMVLVKCAKSGAEIAYGEDGSQTIYCGFDGEQYKVQESQR